MAGNVKWLAVAASNAAPAHGYVPPHPLASSKDLAEGQSLPRFRRVAGERPGSIVASGLAGLPSLSSGDQGVRMQVRIAIAAIDTAECEAHEQPARDHRRPSGLDVAHSGFAASDGPSPGS
jgi:hypothetical protein